jgi:hypothetical protein
MQKGESTGPLEDCKVLMIAALILDRPCFELTDNLGGVTDKFALGGLESNNENRRNIF